MSRTTIGRMFARQLEYLVALDRERHFGRAAATCHVSQPALSEAVRSLERELGVPLVRRSRRFEGFTPEGERVLLWAQRAVADLRGLEQEASRLRGGLDGTLRIGAIPTAVPASSMITTRFREHHPRMRVTLRSATSREISHGTRDRRARRRPHVRRQRAAGSTSRRGRCGGSATCS